MTRSRNGCWHITAGRTTAQPIVIVLLAAFLLPSAVIAAEEEPARPVDKTDQPAASPATPAVELGPAGVPPARNMCVLRPVNLLSPDQISELKKKTEGEVEITQDADLQIIILRAKFPAMVRATDALTRMIHLRTDADDEQSGDDDDRPGIDVHQLKRVKPEKMIALVKQILPHNQATIEHREKAGALVVEGPQRSVKEVIELVRQVDGNRRSYLVNKFFPAANQTRGGKSARPDDERAGDDERRR